MDKNFEYYLERLEYKPLTFEGYRITTEFKKGKYYYTVIHPKRTGSEYTTPRGFNTKEEAIEAAHEKILGLNRPGEFDVREH